MTSSSVARRSGAISVATLLAVPVVLLVVGLVVYVALLRDSKVEVQNGADAAALAAAAALVSDDLLLSDPDRAAARLDRARAAAIALARANFSQGEALGLDRNPDNHPDGDIVFGFQDRPLAAFRPVGGHPHEWAGDRVNAVRVTLGRSPLRAPLGGRSSTRDVRGRATALLDWHVVGFSPQGENPVPLMPIGLSLARKGLSEGEWEPEWRRGRDEWRFDPASGRFERGSDGIPEFEVVLGGPRRRPDEAVAVFLRIGGGSPQDSLRQFRSGVNRDDLAKWGGEFLLGVHNTVNVSGSPDCPPETDPSRGPIEEALRAAGGPRIWPLFSDADPETGNVRVSGWTGARIVSVGHADGGGLRIRLQPAVVSHPSIVADPGRSPHPAFWTGNRTVCAVRLAE